MKLNFVVVALSVFIILFQEIELYGQSSDIIAVENIILKYGKNVLIKEILIKNNNNITLQVGDRLKNFSGNPDQSYVNSYTVLIDINKIGITPHQLEKLVNESLKNKTKFLLSQMSCHLKEKIFEIRKSKESIVIDAIKMKEEELKMKEEELKRKDEELKKEAERILGRKLLIEEEIKRQEEEIKSEEIKRKNAERILKKKKILEEEVKKEEEKIRKDIEMLPSRF